MINPEQAARDLLEGFNKGLKGKKLLNFARRSLTKPDLLSEIISLRDECVEAGRGLIPAADPNGDAALAYNIVACELNAIIERHSKD